MSVIWSAHITQVGAEASDMVEAGCFILFGEPVPEALAEVSLVHDGPRESVEVRPGDAFRVGEAAWRIDQVGERAMANLAELGHVVVYVNNPDQKLLPGAVLATGDADAGLPAVGATVQFVREA